MNDPAATDQPDILTEALLLAKRGFHIVPIKPGQKYPAMKAWQDAATTDLDTIHNWLTGLYRDHGIGIAPRQYGDKWLFVLDVDEHDPANSGSETLHDLEQLYGPIPDTITALTPTGGRHLYLLSPFEIRNDQASKVGPGIDVRGTGGQVLAPPTSHPAGGTYQWAFTLTPDDIKPADAPQWLLDRLKHIPAPKPATTQKNDIWDDLDDSPAANYNRTTTWPQLLEADGWTHAYTDRQGEQHWTRPGKQGGTSATIGYDGRDMLRVFTSSLPWLPEGAYSRFGYTACRQHNGDRKAFARTLTKTPATPTMTATETSEPWPTPIPLTTSHTPPPFPNHTLPTWITNWTNQIAINIQVAIDLPNTLALTAISVICLGNTWITYPRNNWRQPLNTYTAVALPPSAGKTPAKNMIFKPLEDYELETIAQARENKQLTDSRRRILEKQLRDTEDKLAKNNSHNNTHDLHHIIADLAALTNPSQGRLLVDDTTTEALGQTLADNNGRIALISAEGGLFDRIAGMYSDTPNLDLYLEAWSGGRYIVDRIKRDSIHIPNAHLVIGTTIQPATLTELGARKNFAGRGLTARFLLTQPPTNLGHRDRLAITHTDTTIQNIYNQKILQLARHHHNTKTELTLTDQAAELYAQYDQHLENQLKPDQPLEHLAEWVGKLRANTLRLAGLLHIAWQHDTTTVDETTMQHAIDLANYYLTHMTLISEQWGIDETTAKAKKLLAWIKRTNTSSFTIRDIMRHNRRLINHADECLPILQLLIERGWIRPTFDGPILLGQRGKNPQTFDCYPQAGESYPQGDCDGGHNVVHVTDWNESTNSVRFDPEMSRMSRMSRKGGIEHNIIIKKEKPQPHTPGDMGDMDDISPSTTPDPKTDTLQVIHRLLGLDQRQQP